MLSNINAEEIGILQIAHQTTASQSVAEGKGLEEAIANRQAHFSLTTRDYKGRQCYNEGDHETVEIIDEQGRDCATELQIVDNKDGLYKIIYSPRNEGRCRGDKGKRDTCARKSIYYPRKTISLKTCFSFWRTGFVGWKV